MYLIMQHSVPDDYVIATGQTTEVREFVRKTFAETGVTIEYSGKGVEEKGIVTAVATDNPCQVKPVVKPGQVVLEIDPRYYRPTEVDLLIGDATKARKTLGWEPRYTLDDLIRDMMASDIKLMQKEKLLKDSGFRTMNYFE